MKLSDYLEKKKITPYAFSKRYDIPHQSVYKWLAGHMPSDQNKILIELLTDKKVRPKDWFE